MLKTVLHDEHIILGAKMAEFAGYDMPLYYKDGVLEEHLWTRANTGVFDVSHMGVIYIRGINATKLLELATPGHYNKDMSSKYTVLLNNDGGIMDDLIVTKINDEQYFLVVNASRKHHDLRYLSGIASDLGSVSVDLDDSQSILAVQGKEAESILAKIFDRDFSGLQYMSATLIAHAGTEIMINRTGYTGEDGFEVTLPSIHAHWLWKLLLGEACVKPIGLAARDGLRLEAGYPLYGADLNETISPIEASMGWLINNYNQSFRGHERILREKQHGAKCTRQGIVLSGKGVLRPGLKLYDMNNHEIGYLSSGGHSPVLKKSIGFGYIPRGHDKALVGIYGKMLEVDIVPFPFIPLRVKKLPK